ncbi:GNAT family N-acetyltransferase [Pelagovum pacificum]|uniref:GNAT family N-acetyltransferase n=1 Tax=Pelagovum pacificum TaxID=2588711 RepID=A0A5C5GD86_9RHOB|nr:GNAT family N-acetyltransferase [Pelagovum pacificum]QQA42416.1 GNAT family N-acetyltransferase [Pelagovum pacificum]TNY31499.1 GNAT family N-acetyltransferase [Pelagovum pacificum]
MTPEDLARLHAAAFTNTRGWSADEFASLLASTGVTLYGDDRAILLVREIAGEAEILTIATAPNHRRKGLARSLLESFHSETTALEVFLEVAEDNHAAKSLYTTLGYTEAGRRRAYYHRIDGMAVDALVFRRRAE